MSTLYLVATPIGNLEDISHRALSILRAVEIIAAEDTRVTKKLLAHYDIHTPLISYHEHNKYHKTDIILKHLDKGDVALVSDAGTPALNDPGVELVRSTIEAGHIISPIPGPCAPIAALVASGLSSEAFLYIGYLSRKKSERSNQIAEISQLPYTLLILEAPHRLYFTLCDLEKILGNRQITIAREITKVHEEFFRGTLQESIRYYTEHKPRGEITLVVTGKESTQEKWSPEMLSIELRKSINNGEKITSIAGALAKKSGWSRRELYLLASRMQPDKEKT